jgi:hypothetical protein
MANAGLDFQVQKILSLGICSSTIEEWVRTLPLNQLISAALPKTDSSHSTDQLRHLSRMTQDNVKAACDDIMKNLEKILEEHLAILKKAFETLDTQEVADSTAGNERQTMIAGNIDDFHQGLSARIGKMRCLYLDMCFRVIFLPPRGTTSEIRGSHEGGALRHSGFSNQV